MSQQPRVRAPRIPDVGEKPPPVESETTKPIPDVIDQLVAELFAARRALVVATGKGERGRAERRVRVLHAAVALLNQLGPDEAGLERAAKASAKTLKVLHVRDLHGDSDGRGRADMKRMLREVMEKILKQQVLNGDELEMDGALPRALTRAGQALRTEREPALGPADTPTAASPLCTRLAFDFHTYGLCDDAVVAMFGLVPNEAIVSMAHAFRKYAKGLNQHQAPRVEDLCAQALWGAGLLTVKDRSEFFGRMA